LGDFLLGPEGRIVGKFVGIIALSLGIYGFIAFMRWLKRATGNDWLHQRDDTRD
jgi:hypothetical protein